MLGCTSIPEHHQIFVLKYVVCMYEVMPIDAKWPLYSKRNRLHTTKTKDGIDTLHLLSCASLLPRAL